jgi:uncharacterized protein (TIGR02996 family)
MPLYDNPADDRGTEPFLRAIAAAPGDPLPRLQFADWLEEHGYHNAGQGQRWAAKHGKVPRPAGPTSMVDGGWFVPRIGAEQREVDPLKVHVLPYVYHVNSAPDLSLGFGRRSPAEHERAFLAAAHNTPHDDKSNPISNYPPDQLGYQSDIVH